MGEVEEEAGKTQVPTRPDSTGRDGGPWRGAGSRSAANCHAVSNGRD